MQNFSVDISTSRIPATIYVKQGDSFSRFFALTIADNGAPWEAPEDAVYTIRFKTALSSGWYDTIQLPGGGTRPAVVTTENVLTCEVAEQATLGNGQLCVMVNDSTGFQLGTWNLNIVAEIVPGADSPEAEHYYGILAGQIAQVAKDAAAAAASAAAAEKSAEDAKQSALAAKGHTIQNEDGSPMTQREALQFVGFQVNDDPSGKTVVSPKTAGDTKNVAGYVGEITVFADNQLRENHVWADGSTIDPAQWPDLAAYAATAGWQTDRSGWYKTPDLRGRFLLTQSDSHAVGSTGGEEAHTLTTGELPGHTHGLSVGYRTLYMSADEGQNRKSGDLITESGTGTKSYTTSSTGSGQAHNNMPPYYTVTAQIRAKVDEITAKVVEINGNTLGGFTDGQVLTQQGGKIVGTTITPASIGAATAAQGTLASTAVQPYKAGDTISYGTALLAGRATTANVQVTIPLSRPCTATAAKISGRCTIRGADATTLASNVEFSATAEASENAITATIPITYATPPTNYALVSFLATSINITLS